MIVTERWIITIPENEIKNQALKDMLKKFPTLVIDLIEARIPPARRDEKRFEVMTIEIKGEESEIRAAKYYLAGRKIKIEFSIISDI